MKAIGVRVSSKGVYASILSTDGGVDNLYFETPLIYNFNDDLSKILKWHQNNLSSIIATEKIKGLAIKKIERSSFHGRPKDSDIQRMYLEGMILALAGTGNLISHSYYKANIKSVLNISSDYESEYATVLSGFSLERNLKAEEVDAIMVVYTLLKEENLL
jgi:hypothetical protein